ncbi:MAG: Fe2+-dependent dioxygenase [Alphaproteobacteria bacterium]|nr:Fe2+-dependent dioxygenase [Alphaproteobacteria bacterium]
MMRHIKGLLSKDEIRQIFEIMAEGKFEDGAATASGRAREVKNNLQFERRPEIKKRLDQIVVQALTRNPDFMGFAFPRLIGPPTYNRYDVGMFYGNHVDAPFLNNGQLRADISFTLWLSEPDTYDGGELVLTSGYGEVRAKHAAGDAVVYPTTSLHHVAAVTRGSRRAAVSWVESYIPDERQRRILVDMGEVKEFLERTAPQAPETDTFRNCVFNLMRLWWRT